jgi:hypothetical protein
MRIDKGFMRPEQDGFRNWEEGISPYPILRIICQNRKFEKQWYFLCFFGPLKKGMTQYSHI